MPVAFDAATGSAATSFTHTPVGTPRGVIVFCFDEDTGVNFTDVTYGASSLVEDPDWRAEYWSGSEGAVCHVFFSGSSVPTGARTVTISSSGATSPYYVVVTVTANSDVEIFDPQKVQATTTLAERVVTDGSPGSNSLRLAGLATGLNSVPSAGSNSTIVHDNDNGLVCYSVVRETTTGQGGRNVGWSSGTSDEQAALFFAVREITPEGDGFATAAVTLGAQTATASATFTGNTDTASAAVTLGAQTATATATFAAGTDTASAAVTLGAQTATAAATFAAGTDAASAAVTLGAQTASATATFAAGTDTASAAVTLGAQTATASVVNTRPTRTGSASVTLGAQTATATDTYSTGTDTATAAVILAAAFGWAFAQSDFDATATPGTITLRAVTATAVARGSFGPIAGAANVTLGAVTAAAYLLSGSLPVTFAPGARRGLGLSPTGTNYPFVLPDYDIRGLLADFWLAYEDADFVPPLRIAKIFNIGVAFGVNVQTTAHAADLLIQDSAGNTVCDTRDSVQYYGVLFGPRLFVHEWRFDRNMVCRAVQFTKFEPDVVPAPMDPEIVPVESDLDERTYELLPRRLRQIRVGDEILDGDVVLQSGWNFDISTAAETADIRPVDIFADVLRPFIPAQTRVETVMRFSAIAGAGDGAFFGCYQVAEEGLRTINNVPPTQQGAFTLTGRDCIYVAPPYAAGSPTQRIPHALQIGNDCGVCRKCEDYVAAYKDLISVRSTLSEAAEAAELARDEYAQFVFDVEEVVANCVVPITMEVTGGRDLGATSATIGVQITNTTADCLQNIVLTMSVTFDGGTATRHLMHSGTVIVDDNGDAQPYYIDPETPVTWSRIRAGASVRVQFAIVWIATPPALGPTGVISVTAQATADGVPIPNAEAPQVVTIDETLA